jgi:hypothetical protein
MRCHHHRDHQVSGTLRVNEINADDIDVAMRIGVRDLNGRSTVDRSMYDRWLAEQRGPRTYKFVPAHGIQFERQFNIEDDDLSERSKSNVLLLPPCSNDYSTVFPSVATRLPSLVSLWRRCGSLDTLN